MIKVQDGEISIGTKSQAKSALTTLNKVTSELTTLGREHSVKDITDSLCFAMGRLIVVVTAAKKTGVMNRVPRIGKKWVDSLSTEGWLLAESGRNEYSISRGNVKIFMVMYHRDVEFSDAMKGRMDKDRDHNGWVVMPTAYQIGAKNGKKKALKGVKVSAKKKTKPAKRTK